MYNCIVEDCFFNAKHAGFTESIDRHWIGYFPLNTDVAMQFSLTLNQQQLLSLQFKAKGNPYIMAAAEWLCRELLAGHELKLKDYQLLDWQDVFAIPRTQIRTALQIQEACQLLLKGIEELRLNDTGESHELHS